MWPRIASVLRSKPFLITAFIVLAYLLVVLSRVVWQNYQVNQQVALLKQQIETLKQSNDDLKAQIVYYQTDAYREQVARSELGLQKPGEKVLIVPKSGKQDQSESSRQAQSPRSNFQSWWDFFFAPSPLGRG